MVAAGGFLGLGESRFPVEWDELQLVADGSTLAWHAVYARGRDSPARVPAALLGH